MNTVKTNLIKLVSAISVSGYEWEMGITDVIQKLIGYTGERSGDNLVYSFGTGKKTICISAHMDEVGFFISQVTSLFCRIMPIGDISVEDITGTKLIVKTKRGIQTSKRIKAARSFSDIKVYGLTSVSQGDIATYEKNILTKGEMVFAPSLDNKVGCLALISLIKKLQTKKWINEF